MMGRLALCALVVISLVVTLGPRPEASALARAGNGCASVRGSGPFDGMRATVRVIRGQIRCRKARRVARKLFSGKAKYHDECGFGYCSYYTLRIDGRQWRGGISTGAWVMHRCKEADGCPRMVGGKVL
jgi:hypothetical protein